MRGRGKGRMVEEVELECDNALVGFVHWIAKYSKVKK